MKLNLREDWFDDIPIGISDIIEVEQTLEAPEDGDNMGVANLLHNLIISENSLITELNQLITNCGQHEDIKEIATEIASIEMSNLGKLQSALEIVSPNAELIDSEDELEDIDLGLIHKF